jgi:hypothetical protein
MRIDLASYVARISVAKSGVRVMSIPGYRYAYPGYTFYGFGEPSPFYG